jgi:hypothetical protein
VKVETSAEAERSLRPFVGSVEVETRSKVEFGPVPAGINVVEVDLDAGPARVGLMPKAVAP